MNGANIMKCTEPKLSKSFLSYIIICYKINNSEKRLVEISFFDKSYARIEDMSKDQKREGSLIVILLVFLLLFVIRVRLKLLDWFARIRLRELVSILLLLQNIVWLNWIEWVLVDLEPIPNINIAPTLARCHQHCSGPS